jgi:hypothetical protein
MADETAKQLPSGSVYLGIDDEIVKDCDVIKTGSLNDIEAMLMHKDCNAIHYNLTYLAIGERGDIDVLNMLVKYGLIIDLTLSFHRPMSALMQSCISRGHLKMLTYIISKWGITLNHLRKYRALSDACTHEQAHVADFLFTQGFTVEVDVYVDDEEEDIPPEGGTTLLYQICKLGSTEVMEVFIKHGLTAKNIRDDFIKLFHHVCRCKNQPKALAMVKYLIKRGEFTPKAIDLKATHVDVDSCSVCLDNAIYTSHKLKAPGCHPIIDACANGHTDIVMYFIDFLGVTPKDIFNEKLLSAACLGKHYKLAKIILDTLDAE